ncbi:copper chaperone PCu(A)C [Vibrio sp. JC009]|uniref:copper chaperone PCu(A)C n=1 Tax=Vibrio sp. JC009 TaxID=2912314 RepID=UPI0023B08C07|nr:copper chaperone PCu(A)C [Vibrio sp. JC009]WED24907.1 copper chaperone PCu(A)C [Vibrio sp. JC009]
MQRSGLILLTLLTSSFTFAGSGIEIHKPYARAMPPSAPASAVFMTLKNNASQDRAIISASTPAAGKVELHDHIMDGDVMKMRQIPEIVIPANGKTVLKPGSLHIMLFELQQTFTEGEEIEVTVNYKNGQSQTFTAPVVKVMKGMKMKH